MNIDTAYHDRQDLINNLPAAHVLAEPDGHRRESASGNTRTDGEARESTPANSCIARKTDSRGGRQNNVSGGVESRHARQDGMWPQDISSAGPAKGKTELSPGEHVPASGSSAPPAQTLPDTWEAIEAQLDHWAEMDREYWRQRKEKEYAVWLERTYGV
jgi:hypothetical protein